MKRPADLTTDLFAVKQQFYMNVTMPWPGGKTVRMQSTWAVIEILSGNFPENLARNLVIDTMSEDDELIEAYLDAQ